tara:strand:- start:1593 stop:1745 length:153 start_codon:yes stop_codon:yes gene_type:complete
MEKIDKKNASMADEFKFIKNKIQDVEDNFEKLKISGLPAAAPGDPGLEAP